MRIGGLHKTTLLDFPGKIGALVFARGCNFRCPYCHNAHLLREGPCLPAEKVLNFLRRRRGVLQGVIVSGGEPALQDAALKNFCAAVKSLGYAVKLDTNGSRPAVLRALLADGLLDYVAMDVKTDPTRYTAALDNAGENVLQSMAVLAESGVPHEFRVTCAAPLVTPETFAEILPRVGERTPVYLQAARVEQVLDPEFFANGGRALTPEEMERLAAMARKTGVQCAVR